MNETIADSVPSMHCAHCEQAVAAELAAVPGVEAVEVDLDTKLVTVRGESLSDSAVREAIEEAGYAAIEERPA